MRFPWTWAACVCFPLWIVKRAGLGLQRARARRGAFRWFDEVAPGLVVGGIPFPGDLDRLVAEKDVSAVVSLCYEYRDDEDAYRARGIDFLHAPTIDDFPVARATLERACAWIAEQRARGRTVYVHCAAGRGRSVAVALAYLVRERGITTDAALTLVRAARPQAGPAWWQMRVVRAFERSAR